MLSALSVERFKSMSVDELEQVLKKQLKAAMKVKDDTTYLVEEVVNKKINNTLDGGEILTDQEVKRLQSIIGELPSRQKLFNGMMEVANEINEMLLNRCME